MGQYLYQVNSSWALWVPENLQLSDANTSLTYFLKPVRWYLLSPGLCQVLVKAICWEGQIGISEKGITVPDVSYSVSSVMWAVCDCKYPPIT